MSKKKSIQNSSDKSSTKNSSVEKNKKLSTKKNKDINDQLWDEARSARDRAYAPYSRFNVGAALQTESGKIFSGCNVENTSYGATICAERTAVVSAVASGHTQIKKIAIVGDLNGKEVPPCGVCLQVLSEFCEPDAEVILGTPKKIGTVYKLVDLLPAIFAKEFKKRIQ